ncbi:uncharacterized protein BP5553_09232 [Venustampulla echinocandica]|uniref:Adhesin domain-containing protein n=1 Tax=Venustampulla echinocandica TaxID=2656787 RepID=A0A370TC46_9HELO|nr:uncharacterized protein BP5553_09232 [Venustampulla echinocandica]RDL31830.1 hypothetical protein BP5553_09232 [Venustampulla echinocandica]
MPFSDSLYSAEDSDTDSFSDELSPTDGYFNPNRGAVAMPPGMMVQDPSLDLDDKKPEAKVLIPTPHAQAPMRQGSRASSHPAMTQSPSSSSSATHASAPPSERTLSSPESRQTHAPLSRFSPQHPDHFFVEQMPLMGGPPPAYTPSPTTSSGASEASANERRYRTFAENHLERGLLQPHQPESMGGPIEDRSDERTPLSDNAPRATRWRRVNKRVLLLAMLSTMLIVWVATVSCAQSLRHKNPAVNLPPSKGTPAGASGPYCPSATHKNEEVVYEFPVGSDLTVIQTTHDDDGSRYMSHVETKGEVHLRRLPVDSQHGNSSHFTVDVRVSDPNLRINKSWDEHSRTLKISTPRRARLNSPRRHCVSLEITAWFPADAEFTNLLIEAVTLNLRVLEDIKVNVSGRSKLTTLTGDVFFPNIGDLKTSEKGVPSSDPSTPGQTLISAQPDVESTYPFSSRRIVVETTTGQIRGQYPLLDYLAFSTQSGDIKVDVLPEDALPSAPAPADLEVQTASGTISVNLPLVDEKYAPPPRDYITNVHSSAGGIHGTFYLGSLGNFKSNSGTLNFKALPIVQANSASGNFSNTVPGTFETHTVSGVTDIEVLDPLFMPHPNSTEDKQPLHDQSHPDPSKDKKSKTLRNLQSKHSSNSGTVSVSYPKAWEGSIHGKTVSGDIVVKGSGIRTIRERKGWAYNEVLARKGVENKGEGCMVEMSDVAGNLSFFVG